MRCMMLACRFIMIACNGALNVHWLLSSRKLMNAAYQPTSQPTHREFRFD